MDGLIFTNNNCISCNKCVRVCTSPGASYVHTDENSSMVYINAERCIACGACFAMCEHDARDYRDDTELFFEDLEKGEPITLLLAPSFLATYPDEYGSILGGLKALGVRRIISVSFGADICTWAYLKYIEENGFYGGISTPCPVAVSYIEHCLPELIPQMMPIQSPMVCAAIYCREELGITDRLAFIGPCIGKKMETDSYIENSPVHYNLTFLKLMQYVRKHNVCGPDAKDEIEYGLGSFYPAPGGLAENIRWFLGEDVLIRVVSGKTYLYGWLNKNSKNLKEKNTPFLMIDALNCLEGCIEGTGNDVERFEEDRMLGTIQKIKGRSKSHAEGSPWNPDLSPAKRHELLNEQFKNLQLSHYQRSFVDRSGESVMHIPSAEEADGIFNEMLKFTEESRVINCSACGYNSCHDMMVAIYNKFNTKYNCIHFEMDNAQRSVKEAEMANQAKSRFLSRMSHEIRTPINVIIGINNIALRNESISPRIRSDLIKVGVSAKHLLSLVNDILDVTRIESGVTTLKEEKFTFGDIMEQVCVIIGGQCDEKGLTFDHDMAIKPDEVFIGDSLKLKQIIINILGNSVKFTDPPGTVSLTIYEDEGTEKSTAKLRFIIRDTGIGMDAKYIPKIFDVFSQEDTANTTRYSGSGLGMAISKGFAEMMGGEISVESEKGVGSTFTVTVPLRRVLDEVASGGTASYRTASEKAASGTIPTEAPSDTAALEGRCVLIAEDQEMNAEVLIDLLDLEGISSEWARDGRLAVEMFAKSEEGHFDAILMDMRMPVMDGLAATREIRKMGRPDAASIPIIALTANAFEEDVRQCIDAGMNIHQSKPIDIDLLLENLRRLIT